MEILKWLLAGGLVAILFIYLSTLDEAKPKGGKDSKHHSQK